jgi:hypothetical protein
MFAAGAVQSQPVPNAELVRRPLTADTVVFGVPCARTQRAPAEFHLNGRIAACPLARDFAVGRHHFTAGTWLDLNAAGALWGAWLDRDTMLDGHRCRGDGYKAWSVRFHTNGALAGCYLAADTIESGVPCMRGTFLRELRGGGKTALHLFPDGRFRQCMAARDTTVDGVQIAKWKLVVRDSIGATLHVR